MQIICYFFVFFLQLRKNVQQYGVRLVLRLFLFDLSGFVVKMIKLLSRKKIVAQNKSFIDWRVVHNVLFFKIIYFLLLYFHTTTLPHKKKVSKGYFLKKYI